MGAMGEKRRDEQLKMSKPDKKMVGKGEKKASSIETKKEAVPVVLKLRLFVGGLGPTVGASDLQQRFAPLGVVHKIDLVEGKKDSDADEALQRGFAYVDFEASSEASLRKLFSAYNGCKWKGGVLRVEKAKEHYMDRLRREWAEGEAEALVKAKIAEKAAANAISQSRPMYSSKCEDVSGSLGSNRVELEDGDGLAVDADEIAAQIEKERQKQLDLLSKLFPEDKDAGDEEEKVIEIVKLRAFPMATDVNTKKRKHALEENPSESVPVAFSTGVASVLEAPTHESGDLDVNDKHKTKDRRVKFAEEADAHPIESLNDEKVAMKGVRPILKTTQEDAKKMNDGHRNEEKEDDEEEEEEEEYYPSSRSPSPEGGLSDESKWERLFKYAGLKKGPEVTKPRVNGVSSTLDSRLTMWTGISLDDDDGEPDVVAVVETPQRDSVGNDGMFSGVLSEQEDEESDPPPQQSTLGVNTTDSDVLKKKKSHVGSDGIFSDVLSDEEEDDTDSPQASMLGSKVQDSVALKKAKRLIEEPEMSSDALPDQADESSDFEDTNDASSDSEMDEEDEEEDEDEDEDEDEEEVEDEDMEDFVDAKAPLNEAAKASKWAKMFKSATTSVAEPVEGVFSGSLDVADVPVGSRPAVKVQRMFESAAANHTGSVTGAPKVSDNTVASEMEEDVSRRSKSEEENACTISADIPNQDVAKTENNNTTDASEEEEEGASDLQTGGVVGGNLLARFNMEQDEPHPSNSTPQPEGQNAIDDNTKWMQRATWKSLLGADGRATFSLKQLTGESETTKATDVKETEKAAVPGQSLNAFSFNLTRNPPAEATTSRPKSMNIERAEKMPKSGSAVERTNLKPAKVSEDEAGCSFMKSADAEKEWRASKSELRMDSKAKHKAAVRKMKKMKGSGGAR